MRLAGINLNDPSTFNKMINDGNDIKNYITSKEKELEDESKHYAMVQKALDMRLVKQFNNLSGAK